MTEGYADLADLGENERIRIMSGHAAAGKVIACVTDNEDEKIARYIEKMLQRGGVRHIHTQPGPVPGTATLSFGPELNG